MRNKLFYFSGLAFLTAIYAATPASAPVAAPLTFPAYGFSINPFDLPTPANGAVLQALSMSWPMLPLPSNSGILAQPSVNVIVWPGNDDMSQYENREKLDLQMRGLTVQSEVKNTDNSDWKLEYIGLSNGVAMHWYAHVARDTNKRIYIATGSIPDEMWSQFGPQIKSCVDSLKATGTAQVAPLPVPTLVTAAPASAAASGTAKLTP